MASARFLAVHCRIGHGHRFAILMIQIQSACPVGVYTEPERAIHKALMYFSVWSWRGAVKGSRPHRFPNLEFRCHQAEHGLVQGAREETAMAMLHHRFMAM